MMLCQRTPIGVVARPTRPKLFPVSGIRQRVRVQATSRPPSDDEQPVKKDQGASVFRNCLNALSGAVAGCAAWTALAGSAFAAVDNADQIVLGPSTDMLLNSGDEFSFTSLLLYTLLGYWLIKALQYLSQHSPDGHDEQDGKDGNKQQQGGGNSLSDVGHAHIRSYVDSSQPGPDGWLDARDLRNTSLARSAAYRVTAMVRESQPRIHELVEELAGPGPASHWPLQAPRHADVDFVASMVYDRVVKERMAKGPDADLLTPRERAALETMLLEEVAERCAAEQVTEFIHMAAQGKLHPRQTGGDGAGHPPPSPAH